MFLKKNSEKKMEERKSASPQPTLTQSLSKSQESNANQQANNPITRKLNKILESRIENDKVIIVCFSCRDFKTN